jgi:hypothetical protein
VGAQQLTWWRQLNNGPGGSDYATITINERRLRHTLYLGGKWQCNGSTGGVSSAIVRVAVKRSMAMPTIQQRGDDNNNTNNNNGRGHQDQRGNRHGSCTLQRVDNSRQMQLMPTLTSVSPNNWHWDIAVMTEGAMLSRWRGDGVTRVGHRKCNKG